MTRLLGSAHIEVLAREESVRGVLVRAVIKQSEFADEQELELLEDALQLLLKRFQAMDGEAS
ncbi:hypothetical protein ACFLZU_04240 [Thermodesulfobacteriota bacterium]